MYKITFKKQTKQYEELGLNMVVTIDTYKNLMIYLKNCEDKDNLIITKE